MAISTFPEGSVYFEHLHGGTCATVSAAAGLLQETTES